MSDLIDREAAIDAIKKSRYLLEAMKKVIKLPPAEPERKTGKWIRIYSRPGVYADLAWHCSNCGARLTDGWANKYRFCPDCGAEMEEVIDD